MFGLGALGLSVIQAAKVAGARYKDTLNGLCDFQINSYIYILKITPSLEKSRIIENPIS